MGGAGHPDAEVLHTVAGSLPGPASSARLGDHIWPAPGEELTEGEAPMAVGADAHRRRIGGERGLHPTWME